MNFRVEELIFPIFFSNRFCFNNYKFQKSLWNLLVQEPAAIFDEQKKKN